MRLSNAPENFRDEFDLPTLSGYLYVHNPKNPYCRMWCFRITCRPCVAYCLPQLDEQMRLQFPINDEWEVVCPGSTGFILEVQVGSMLWSRDTAHQDTVKDALNCLQRFYSAFNEHYPPITDRVLCKSGVLPVPVGGLDAQETRAVDPSTVACAEALPVEKWVLANVRTRGLL